MKALTVDGMINKDFLAMLAILCKKKKRDLIDIDCKTPKERVEFLFNDKYIL